MFNGKNILITGGSGSLGRRMLKTLLKQYEPKKVVIFSRDELKQHQIAQKYPKAEFPNLRLFIGDVRDESRLREAFRGMDYVIHAAALKQVDTAEYNPFEAIKTNVLGAQNVIQAAIAQGVQKVIALSTDKATSPVNLYGASKLCSDKLFIAGNSMSGSGGTRFSVVRYGNVVGSRGSVIPLFLERAKTGVIPITDDRMTRFSITLHEGVELILRSFEYMAGGEIFVPKIPSYRIVDVAKAIAPDAKIQNIGIRPGEKLHEVMVPEDESRMTLEYSDRYVIQPPLGWWEKANSPVKEVGKPVADGFSYSSNGNTHWLSIEEIRKVVEDYQRDHLTD